MAGLEDIDKCRRDLYAVSLGLLVFNLAGGSLSSDAPTIFGSVHITRTWILAVGAWSLWAYFLWRFWLAARPIWRSYLDDVDREIYRSSSYALHCSQMFLTIEHLAREALNDPNSNGFARSGADLRSIADNASNHAKWGLLFTLHPHGFGRSYDPRSALSKDGAQKHGAIGVIPDGTWAIAVAQNPWLGRPRRLALMHAVPMAAYRLHAFSDRILPLIVAATALLSQVGRMLWHSYGHAS